jgi:hypothetical protein
MQDIQITRVLGMNGEAHRPTCEVVSTTVMPRPCCDQRCRLPSVSATLSQSIFFLFPIFFFSMYLVVALLLA